MSIIYKLKIPYNGAPTDKEPQVLAILRFCLERESVSTLKDILKAEKKKRREGKKNSRKKDKILANFASKEKIIKKLLKKHLRTCPVLIDYSAEREAMCDYWHGRISDKGLLDLANIDFDVNFRHPVTKQTFLHIAAMHDRRLALKFLLESNADPNLPDAWGSLPIHDAIDKRMLGNATLLIPCTRINARDENGVAPLHLAVLRQSLPLINELLKFHADPNPRLKPSGYTPLHLSVMKDDDTVPQLLLQNGANPNIMPTESLSSTFPQTLSELRVFHRMLQGNPPEPEHATITCNGCQIFPFSGLCTHCTICNFDMCPNCAFLNISTNGHLYSHPLELWEIASSDKVNAQRRIVEEVQRNGILGTEVDIAEEISKSYLEEQRKSEQEDNVRVPSPAGKREAAWTKNLEQARKRRDEVERGRKNREIKENKERMRRESEERRRTEQDPQTRKMTSELEAKIREREIEMKIDREIEKASKNTIQRMRKLSQAEAKEQE